MDLFRYRPLALSCFAFLSALAIGITLLDGARGAAVLGGALFLLSALFAVLALRRRRTAGVGRRLAAVALALVFAAVGMLHARLSYGVAMEQAKARCGEGTVLVLVDEISSVNDFSRSGRGRLLDADGGSIPVRFVADGELAAGDLLYGEGTVTLFREREYDFNERDYYLAEGMLASVTVDTVYHVQSIREAGATRILQRFNRLLRAKLAVDTDRRVSGLLSGMFLGNRADVPDEVRRDFAELGISHLLALSGLHLAILCGFFERLLGGVSHRARCLLLIGLALLYAALTGFSPSAVRAALMLSAVYGASLFGYRTDSVTVLFAVATVMCAAEPYLIVNTSFLLSVLAMLSCLAAGRFGRRPRRGGGVAALRYGAWCAVRASVLVSLVTLPVIGGVSGRVSILTPLINLLYIPAATVLLTLCPLLLLLRFVPVLSHLLAIVTEGTAAVILHSSRWLASLHVGVFSIVSTAEVILLGFLAVALLLLFLLPRRMQKRLVAVVLILFIGTFAVAGAEEALLRDDAVITAISYKTNDLFTLRYEGDNYVIDVSNGADASLDRALGSLRAQGERQIRALILTHYHQRHVGALRTAAEQMYLTTLCLPTPETEADEAIYGELCRTADLLGVEVVSYRRRTDTALALGDAVFTPADYARLSRSTHPTVGFALEANGKTFAYLGASLAEGDPASAEVWLASADATYFGSHGPKEKKPLAQPTGLAMVTPVSAPLYEGQDAVTVGEKHVLILSP